MAPRSTVDVVRDLQAYVFQRRVRVRDFCKDYDSHRERGISREQFVRALDRTGIRFSEQDRATLTAHYSHPELAPQVQVDYEQFCRDVDEVFGQPQLPDLSTQLSEFSELSVGARSPSVQEALHPLLSRLAMLCQVRGVAFKACYSRASGGSPARMTPRQTGKVPKSQFIRIFPFADKFPLSEIDFIADAFTTKSGDVDVRAVHDALVRELGEGQGEAESSGNLSPRSDVQTSKTDGAEWSHHTLHPVDKLRAKIVEKRVRLYGLFQDFDPLRKGLCTKGQVNTVFAILNLTTDLDRDGFDRVIECFRGADGFFNYRGFCAEVEKDFSTPGLEKNPETLVSMPDASTTLPGRRNKMFLAHAALREAEAVHEKVAARVRRRGILLKPAFQDMDRTRRGHISATQFGRVLAMLDFRLATKERELLVEYYSDLGNRTEVNYVDFCMRIDIDASRDEGRSSLSAASAVDVPAITGTPPPREVPQSSEDGQRFCCVQQRDRGLTFADWGMRRSGIS